MINIYILRKIIIKNKNTFKKKILKIILLEKKNIYMVNYIFCNNKYILKINKKFLKKKYYTDTITFNYNRKNNIWGDIFISVDQVIKNSIIWKERFISEIKRVIVHSLLHLLGYNDNNLLNKKKMRKKENFYIKLLKNIYISYE